MVRVSGTYLGSNHLNITFLESFRISLSLILIDGLHGRLTSSSSLHLHLLLLLHLLHRVSETGGGSILNLGLSKDDVRITVGGLVDLRVGDDEEDLENSKISKPSEKDRRAPANRSTYSLGSTNDHPVDTLHPLETKFGKSYQMVMLVMHNSGVRWEL